MVLSPKCTVLTFRGLSVIYSTQFELALTLLLNLFFWSEESGAVCSAIARLGKDVDYGVRDRNPAAESVFLGRGERRGRLGDSSGWKERRLRGSRRRAQTEEYWRQWIRYYCCPRTAGSRSSAETRDRSCRRKTGQFQLATLKK
jgi:hypothetical protein